MSDIVERLREISRYFSGGDIYGEAANEIERLHAERDAEIRRAEQFNERLGREIDRAEKAEAKVAQLDKVIKELNRAVARSETL